MDQSCEYTPDNVRILDYTLNNGLHSVIIKYTNINGAAVLRIFEAESYSPDIEAVLTGKNQILLKIMQTKKIDNRARLNSIEGRLVSLEKKSILPICLGERNARLTGGESADSGNWIQKGNFIEGKNNISFIFTSYEIIKNPFYGVGSNSALNIKDIVLYPSDSDTTQASIKGKNGKWIVGEIKIVGAEKIPEKRTRK